MSNRKRNRHQKPRIDSFYATISAPSSEAKVSINQQSGEITVHGADSNSGRFVRRYARESGKDKIVSSIPTGRASGFFDLMSNIKRNFKQVVAIDTNTRTISGKLVSVTCSYFTPNLLSPNQTETDAELLGGFISFDCGVNPETLGWYLIISKYVKPYLLSADNRLAIVVDSELGRLESYNRSETPYFGEHVLPEHIQFIYASDIDSDSLPGMMIRTCDSIAGQVLDVICSPSFVMPLPNNGDSLHRGHVPIDFEPTNS